MTKFLNILAQKLVTSIKGKAYFRTRKPNEIDIILECHDVDRGLQKNELAYAQILDGFQDELAEAGYECITLAKLGSKLIDDAYGDVRSPISVFEQFLGFLIYAVFRKEFHHLKYHVWLYKKWILHTNCKIVIGIQPSTSLVAASNALGVPVIDLLHGYGVTPTHKIYGFESINKIRDELLCTDYVALDNYSKTVLEKNFSKSNKSVRCWSYLSPVLKSIAPKGVLPHEEFAKDYRKNFLVILQWGINRFEQKFPHDDGELPPRLVEVIEAGLDRGLGFGFIVKPHPVLIRNEAILGYLRKNCQQVKGVWLEESTDLKTLLRVVDGVITIFSTSTREAAMLGVKTLLFSSDEELFVGDDHIHQCEIESGMAIRVNRLNINEILNFMESMSQNCICQNEDYLKAVQPKFRNAVPLVSEILHHRKGL